MLLEAGHRRRELLEGLRKALAHGCDRLRRADAGDDVLPLRVDEELAPEPGLARGRVAREGNPGTGVVSLVAEDHLDDVHRRAEVVGDAVRAAVDLSARRVPRVEDRPDGALELVAGVLRKVRVETLEARHELAQVLAAELDVLRDAALGLEGGELLLEELRVDAADHLSEHLDEPPVGVEREPLVPGGAREPVDRLVVQAEVEDRVHHPRHRDRRARAHGDEQRVGRVAEALAGCPLEARDCLVDLDLEPFREPTSEPHVLPAGLGRHGEARRHRQPDRGHLREPDALAAEQLAAEPAPLREVVDELRAHALAANSPIRRISVHPGDPPAGE